MKPFFDTIVAPITGPGPAAVAVVRLSGPEAWMVASEVFGSWPLVVEPRKATYGHFVHGDDGLVLPFEEGHSFTGEQTVEMSIHGSRASVRGLVDSCLKLGARMAEPGEFTHRAFLNGRIDLTQAEAVRETVDSQTERQLKLANLIRDGALRRRVDAIRDGVVKLLVAVEASTDFSEEIGELDQAATDADLASLIQELERLLQTSTTGWVVRNGLRIAIVGPPNAGKSSLLNALLGADRAIVTAIPGTTRDYVEEMADFDGLPVVLIDTAGLRDSQDEVEALGIQRSRAQAAAADLIWYVYDASIGLFEGDLLGFETAVRIGNKCDLGRLGNGLFVSALTREGLDQLVRSTLERFDSTVDVPLVNVRQRDLLASAREALLSARTTLASNSPDDLLAVDFRDAAESLGEITGETATPDVIERIFHDFCIGK